MSEYKHFSDAEVTKWQLVPELWHKLEIMRDNTITVLFPTGVPIIITSGKRSKDGNSVLKGAVPDSSHLTGEGCDVRVYSTAHYFALLKGAYAAGLRRHGHYFTADQASDNLIPKHLHFDIDKTKQQDCSWCKREQN